MMILTIWQYMNVKCYDTSQTNEGWSTMYQFRIIEARKLAAKTGMNEFQAYRELQLRETMERRSGDDRRALIRANLDRRAAGDFQ